MKKKTYSIKNKNDFRQQCGVTTVLEMQFIPHFAGKEKKKQRNGDRHAREGDISIGRDREKKEEIERESEYPIS